MKKDGEINLFLEERRKGASQKLAAARTGMSERTVRKYEQAGKLPSQMKVPRTHRTRANPFAADWPWVEDQLRRDQALQTKTLFALLCQAYPGRYQESQLRTLQRHVHGWRIQHGDEREVMFQQEHVPGRMAQSDFTVMNALGVTIGGVDFPHLVYHMVLTYSNVEAVRVCFSESFEALSEGLEACLWQIAGVSLAFANYCYREELFPTTTFRRAYDALLEATPSRADRDYLRLLHLAASGSEVDVEQSIAGLLAMDQAPTFDAVREQLDQSLTEPAPALEKATINLASYDSLIPSRSLHG